MLTTTAISRLQATLSGDVIEPKDARYDEARAVFNGMIDKRPALIARCATSDDVIAAVNLAREAGVEVAVRGGGHGVTGAAICDDGIVIDLTTMNSVRVDQSAQTALAGGGTIWGQFDRETQAVGLATTGGIVPSTGVAGLTLGGGIGFLNRKYGLSCDNLISAEMVAADGRLLKASREENDDLFWGLRGGGGNFGVVTALEYRIHPVGPVLGGERIYPLEQAKEVLRFYRDWSLEAPDEVRADVALLSGPEGPALDVMVCYCGPIDEGERVLQPLRSFGSPLVDTIAAVPYETIQNLLTHIFQPGRLHYWKASFIETFSDEAIEALVEFFASDVPGFFAAIAIEHLGGAISRVGRRDTAFWHRDAQHSLLVLRMWEDQAESEKNIDWARRCYAAVEPFLRAGTYVNYLGSEGDARIMAAYGDNYERLQAIKSKYDPANVFRSNQNVKPA